MERFNRWKEKVLGSGGDHCDRSSGRLGHWLVVFTSRSCLTLSLIGLIGCTTLKKAGIVGLAGGSGALAGTVLSGGAAAPILGATVTALAADVVTEVIPIGQGGKKVMSDCAPDNFWSLLGSLVEMGGWFLLLLILVPMVLGWVLPGPLERKKKSSS